MSSTTVGRLLHALGYRLQSVRKRREATSVISVDTKTKELVGDFKNAGQEWQPTGAPEPVRVHDVPGEAVGNAIPYGVC